MSALRNLRAKGGLGRRWHKPACQIFFILPRRVVCASARSDASIKLAKQIPELTRHTGPKYKLPSYSTGDSAIVVVNVILYAVHFGGFAPSLAGRCANVCASEAEQLRQIALDEPAGCRTLRRTVAL